MTASSPVPEPSPPAPRPASPTLVPAQETTPLISATTATTAADETTPLLSTSTDPPPSSRNAVVFASKILYVLTILALVFSAVTLVLIGVTIIVAKTVVPDYYPPYQVSNAFNALPFQAILSICISSFNVSRLRLNRVPAPLLVNLIFDFFISFYTTVYASSGLAAVYDGYEPSCYNPGEDETVCVQRTRPIRILAAVALGTGLVFGIVHLVLFVIRCVGAYSTKFWRRPVRFPMGQLTVEFTVKLLREPERDVVEEAV